MDDRGVSSFSIVLDSAPSGPSLLVAPSAWLGEDLGEMFMHFLTVLVKHLSYPIRVEFIFKHEVGEHVWKRISDKRTKNQAKTDKTEHEMEKHGKDK
ncbi:hypothetical protein Tco_0061934, partial [Tanacetum coccineum]